jgi:N-acetylneuraminic acid mutarotase
MKARVSAVVAFLLALVSPFISAVAQDTWAPTTTTGAPTARSGHTAVWTGSEMILWGGVGTTGSSETNTGGRYNPAIDAWTATSTVGAPAARLLHSAVWTGSRMIVWGGVAASSGTLMNTGGAYDPISNTWAAISVAGAPSARVNASAVWTGREMIVWGGDNNMGASSTMYGDGARYDPISNTWSPIDPTGAPSGRDFGRSAVWTDREFIIWGGRTAAGAELADGGRYDPILDQWSAVSLSGNPSPRAFHGAVWTGREMIVWGGTDAAGTINTGDRYDPISNSWSQTPLLNAPAARIFHTAVWTGQRMLVWGGSGAGSSGGLSTGGSFDPYLGTWVPLSNTAVPLAVGRHTAVWTGREMIVWGGLTDVNFGATATNLGGRYLPTPWPSDSWSPMPTSNAPTARVSQTAVWTGREMIVWGGNAGGPPFGDGGKYDPVLESWAATTLIGAPSARDQHTAVWTGREMIVWGGATGAPTTTGGRYNPLTNSWTPTSTTGAPSARQAHTAVWTGREMIVWGGAPLPSGFSSNDGARYDPKTDSWTPVSTTGAPPGRALHSAVWTGREMIVWGGNSYAGGPSTIELNSGGRYDPATNSWSPLTLTGAPTARIAHSAVWTGDLMIIWSGAGGLGYTNTGGRYSPLLDTWTPTTTSSAPTARTNHQAIWTGREMIVWGGATSFYEDTGARYVPASDAWVPTTISGAPPGRQQHSAVWTGSRMLVWGGSIASLTRTNTGGAYGGDGTPPNAGSVGEGLNGDLIFQLDTTSLSANWSGFADVESGISRYEWAIGSAPGATDIQPFTDVGTVTSATATGLSLTVGATYYVTARATNGDGRTVTAASNGVFIGEDLRGDSGCVASLSGSANPLSLVLGAVLLIVLWTATRTRDRQARG